MLRNWALALRPTLSLDFLAGLNDSRITYSGGANGTRVNSSGNIVAATTPRFDYDPVTLAAKGLLVEEARTNLLTYSQEFDNAAWARFGTTSITANAVTSPDGTTNADLLTMTSAGSGTFQAATGAASTAYTGTVYLRAAAPVTVNLILTTNLLDPVIVACSVTTAWQRFTVNKTTSLGTTVIALQVSDTGAGGTSVYLWGAQTEVGSFATSYIPTTSASVTRTADSAVMTGTNFSSWYNQSEGTFVVSYSRPTAIANSFVVDVSNNTFNEFIGHYTNGAPDIIFNVRDNGSVQFATTVVAGGGADGVVYTAGISLKLNDFAACANGGTATTSGSGTLPTPDRINIGSFGLASQFLNGHIRSIVFYPGRLSNEQLQALTS